MKKLNIVLRLRMQSSGKWRVGMSVTTSEKGTRYTLNNQGEIKNLPVGLMSAGNVIQEQMIPRLEEIMKGSDDWLR